MGTTSRAVLCVMVASWIFLLNGCRKSSDAAAPVPQAAPAATETAAKERHHGLYANGISPLIVSMSPETVQFHDGHVGVGKYSLTYEINNSEKATKAYISVYAPGVGEVQRRDIDVQPRGTIEFYLDASNFDLGPTVRFRAHCPYGDTDWFTMGSDPMAYPQIQSTSEIGNVTPGYVPALKTIEGGVPITIAGSKFTRECTAEAQVDSSSVELQNVVASNTRINGLLRYEDLKGRPVVSRHFEVKLVVNGPGMAVEDIFELKFVE